MDRRFNDYPRLIFAIVLTAALMTAAPAIGHGVDHALFAHDSEKVDGKSAVGATAGANARARKLVTTNGKGQFGKGLIPGGIQDTLVRTGPLPIEAEFKSNGGDYLMMVSGSGYRSSLHPGRIGMFVLVEEGNTVFQYTAQGYTNEKGSHKAFVPIFREISPPKGPFTIRLEPWVDPGCNNNTFEMPDIHRCTSTDNNDHFNVTLLEIP